MKKIMEKFLTVKTFITVFLVVFISIMVKEGVAVPEWYLAAAFYPVLQSLFGKDNINVKALERLRTLEQPTQMSVSVGNDIGVPTNEEELEPTSNPEESEG